MGTISSQNQQRQSGYIAGVYLTCAREMLNAIAEWLQAHLAQNQYPGFLHMKVDVSTREAVLSANIIRVALMRFPPFRLGYPAPPPGCGMPVQHRRRCRDHHPRMSASLGHCQWHRGRSCAPQTAVSSAAPCVSGLACSVTPLFGMKGVGAHSMASAVAYEAVARKSWRLDSVCCAYC